MSPETGKNVPLHLRNSKNNKIIFNILKIINFRFSYDSKHLAKKFTLELSIVVLS